MHPVYPASTIVVGTKSLLTKTEEDLPRTSMQYPFGISEKLMSVSITTSSSIPMITSSVISISKPPSSLNDFDSFPDLSFTDILSSSISLHYYCCV